MNAKGIKGFAIRHGTLHFHLEIRINEMSMSLKSSLKCIQTQAVKRTCLSQIKYAIPFSELRNSKAIQLYYYFCFELKTNKQVGDIFIGVTHPVTCKTKQMFKEIS